jgi:hypothetical protein
MVYIGILAPIGATWEQLSGVYMASLIRSLPQRETGGASTVLESSARNPTCRKKTKI